MNPVETYWTAISARPAVLVVLVVTQLDRAVAGCHPNRRQLSDEQSCSGDQIYCWMSCQPVVREEGDDCDTSEALCRDPVGALWPYDFTTSDGTITHCQDCLAKCPVPTKSNLSNQTYELCNTQFQASSFSTRDCKMRFNWCL